MSEVRRREVAAGGTYIVSAKELEYLMLPPGEGARLAFEQVRRMFVDRFGHGPPCTAADSTKGAE